MLVKNWKKIGAVILIIAIVINIGYKLFNIISFDNGITQIKNYIEKFNKDKK